MKILDICLCGLITLFQLTTSTFSSAPSLETTCGKVELVRVSNVTTKTHFPWVGALYNVANKTKTGDIKYLCGATLISQVFSVTGN